MENERYLGDGAYARIDDGYQLEIYASNGIVKTNQVFLGPTELKALFQFARQFWDITP